MVHKSVLLGEAIENLNLKRGDIVIDGTLGSGGHMVEILKRVMPGGKLIGIDWDERAILKFKKRLREDDILIPKRDLILVNDNYANIDSILRGLGVKTADAVLLDLGFSSDQIENAERGFSFLKDGNLDMRYSPETQSRTAANVVNDYSQEELKDIFQRFGEERFSGRIARAIVESRRAKPIKRTLELVEVIRRAIPKKFARGRIHPATRVFQALRIEVNRELENLEKFLDEVLNNLTSGGRLVIISFHSLEDRVVKNFFKANKDLLKIVTKKPVVPSREEITDNPRSRSAKLRAAERISTNYESSTNIRIN